MYTFRMTYSSASQWIHWNTSLVRTLYEDKCTS